MNKTNRKIDEDGIFINLKCPKCGRKNCVQGLTRMDATTTWNKPKHLFRCTYSDCHYQWEDEEGNRIEELKDYCNKIIEECYEEGLESISNLAAIIKLHKAQKTLEVKDEKAK